MKLELHVHIHQDYEFGRRFDRVDRALALLTMKGNQVSNDLTVLQATVAALGAKATETNATLAGLAQAIIDLKNAQPADVQAGIDALAAEAQTILDGLTAAEDSADDQLPPA
jgi:uncharacterized phage infection (PIP) family protein YhgE